MPPNPTIKCPICKEEILCEQPIFQSPMVNLHGSSLHAIIIFVNQSGQIKAIEGCQSIEIQRNAKTFTNLLHQFRPTSETIE